MISPNKLEMLADEVRKLYVDLEVIILEKIKKRVEKGIDAPNWLSIKLSETQKVRQEIEILISEFQKNSDSKVLEIITKVFNDGYESADIDFEKLGFDLQTLIANAPLLANTTNINAVAINAIVLETQNLLQSMNFQILRKSQDIYRQIISSTATTAISGVETRRQAVQRTLNEFANKGINGFVDKKGRNWEIGSYSDMAVRTAINKASMAGHEQRITQLGEDLLIVSQETYSCPLCDRWERKILSISGTNPKYPSVAQAKAGGLWHPNCSHVATLYVEGFSTVPKPIQKTGKEYDDTQKQRYLERQIRLWKRREAVAINAQDKQIAQNKIKEKQKAMRDFLSTNDLRRRYDREQLGR